MRTLRLLSLPIRKLAAVLSSFRIATHQFAPQQGFVISGKRSYQRLSLLAMNAFYFYLMLFPSTLRSEERDQIFIAFPKAVRYALRLRAESENNIL